MKRLAVLLGIVCVLVWVVDGDAQRRIGGVQRGGSSGAGDPLREPTTGGGVSAPAGFCAGTELFCADFETDAQIAWTSTPATEDCDGYDADNDWCDYDITTHLLGTASFGIRGARTTAYIAKDL